MAHERATASLARHLFLQLRDHLRQHLSIWIGGVKA